MKVLHRISFKGKSVYCGYSNEIAAKEFFALEPEATAEEPVVWVDFLVPDKAIMPIESREIRRKPEPTGPPH